MATPVYTDDIIPAQNRAEITSVNDDDLLIVSQDNALKKITKANLQETLGVNDKANSTDVTQALAEKADQDDLDVTNNNVSANSSNISTNASNIATVDSRQDVILENKVEKDYTFENPFNENYDNVEILDCNIDDKFLLKNTLLGDKYTIQLTDYPVTEAFISSNEIVGESLSVATVDSTQVLLRIKHFISNPLDGTLLLMNLTDIFGTGLEPSAELMAKFIEQTGYFNDFHTMTNMEIALAYSEYEKDQDAYVAQIASAVVALGGII